MRGNAAKRLAALLRAGGGRDGPRAVTPAALGGAALTGLLAGVAFPAPGLDLAIFACLVPLWLAAEGRSVAAGALLGYTAGAVGNAVAFSWVFHAIRAYGSQFPAPVAALMFAAWLAYASTYWAVLGAVAAWALARPGPRRLILVLAGIALEAWYPRLFPWHFADALYRRIRWIQIAEIAGPAALTGVILSTNAALAAGLAALRARRRMPWAAAAGAALLLGGMDLYGRIRLPMVRAAMERAPERKARLVQPNVSIEEKMEALTRPKLAARILKRLREATGDASGIDLVLWPESVVPYRLQFRGDRLGIPRDLPREAALIAGAPTIRVESDRLRLYNSAFVLTPGGPAAVYHKANLLLFGEKIPLSRAIPAIGRIVGLRSLDRGRGPKLFDAAGERVGTVICYEGILPRYVRRFGRLGMTVLVNLTEDGWYGRTSEPWEHLALVVLRAVENRVPVLRATNSGISASIDATGRIDARTALAREEVLDVGFRPLAIETPYERFGPLLPALCAAGALLMLAAHGLFSLTRARRLRILRSDLSR